MKSLAGSQADPRQLKFWLEIIRITIILGQISKTMPGLYRYLRNVRPLTFRIRLTLLER